MTSPVVLMRPNHLLALLSRKDRLALGAASDVVAMRFRDVLWAQGQAVDYAYFPLEGYISLLATIDEGSTIEVGMVGVEGMIGIGIGLGVRITTLQALVQEQGSALRIHARTFSALLSQSESMRKVMGRFAFVHFSHLATACACIRFHHIDARLARWLLMCSDRSPASGFPMTHAFLSSMLGVRRVSVTNAASALQSLALIRYQRGHVNVTNRAGLEAAACSCYAQDKKTYDTVFPSTTTKDAL